MKKHLLAALAALTLAAPIAAQAQVAPSYAASANTEEDVHGRVVSFDGAYSLTVRDERGFIDNVQLHQGTIINPTGLTLAPGMVVNVLGFDAGGFLAANEIDTPYTVYGGVPYYQGQVWSYWGPSVSLAFFFGNVGWWHGGYFGGPYAWNGGVRVYNNVSYNVYRNVSVYHTTVDRNVYRTNVDRNVYRTSVAAYHAQPAPVDHLRPGYENPVPLGRNVQPNRAPVTAPHQASAVVHASRPSEGHERR
jgi:hypothetical protein